MRVQPTSSSFTRRSFLVSLGASIASLALLAACGASSSTTSTATSRSASTRARSTASATRATTAASSVMPPKAAVATPATGVATLRWIFGDMDQGRAKLLDKVAAQFEQSHPGVKVHTEYSRALETSIPTWAASGTLYDVFFNLTNMIAARAAKGMTVPLDPFIAQDHLSLAQFNSVEMESCTWQGKVQALPFDWSIFMVYYNKDMFKKAGIALPPADGKWTFDDLLATAKHFSKSESGHQVQWGYGGLPNSWSIFGFLEANGGKVLSSDLKQCIVNDPQNIATLEFFRDLVRKWHVAPGPGELPEGAGNPFVANLTAMQMQGSWAILAMRTSIGTRFDWDIAPLPQGSTGKTAASAIGAAWSIGESTKQPDMAWELLKFVSSPQAEALSLGSGSLPGNVGAYPAYRKIMEQGSQPPQHYSTIIDVVQAGVFPVPNVPYYDQMMPILNKAISAIYAGQDPTGMLGQAQQQINAIIPQYTF